MLGDDYDDAIVKVARESLEGKLIDVFDENNSDKPSGKCFVVSITEVKRHGDGAIVHGDGGVYQTIHYRALGYLPEMQEIVEGLVVSVQKFGAFVRFGPFEGLLHISQIMDDRIDLDLANQRFIGKDTKRDLRANDRIRVRIVAMNLSSSSIEDSKIGLTMKQVGLGKLEWLIPRKTEA
jgi:DNA-directed RNA polymerase subunit E'